MFMFAGVNIDYGVRDFFWPLVWRGLALSSIFIPLSVATLGAIPRQEVAAAAGVYNLTRQIGGSIGIAILATFLSNRQQFHYARLAEHVGAYDPRVGILLHGMQGYMQSRGYDFVRGYQAGVALLH